MKKTHNFLFKVGQIILAKLMITLVVVAQTTTSNTVGKFEEREATYANGALNLAGTLLFPSRTGPLPAVVIVHGSGNSDRSNPWTTAYAKAFAQRGIAVLHPDKRGSGKSQGDWRTVSFIELADDAIAGVEFLRKDPRIDKERIEVIGFSQGGHIIAAAATRAPQIAFAINVSGSTVPILEQIADEVETSAERAGLTAGQIGMVKDINLKGLNYAMTGKGWDEYLAALNAAKAGELKGQQILAGFPTTPGHPSVTHIRAIGDFDPMAFWKKTSLPVLFVYGGQDTQVRVHKSIRRIEETLSANKRNYTVLLFNSNGHTLFREDELDFLARWITDRGTS